MSSIEQKPENNSSEEPPPEDRQRLILWRIDWLWEEINERWGEESEYFDRLEEDLSYWQDELDNPEGEDVPDLDDEGRPIGFDVPGFDDAGRFNGL